MDISIPELVQSGQTGITSTWPLNIPASGKQTEYKLNVPVRRSGPPLREVRMNPSIIAGTARGTPR